jgi:hypothetical protein
MDPGTREKQAAPSDGWAEHDQEPLVRSGRDGSGDPAADGLTVTYDFLRRQIEERPLTVLAVTLGAGFLLGSMLSDRR